MNNNQHDQKIDNTPDQNPDSQPVITQPGQSQQSNSPMKDVVKKDFQPDAEEKKKSQQQAENDKHISQQKKQQQQQ